MEPQTYLIVTTRDMTDVQKFMVAFANALITILTGCTPKIKYIDRATGYFEDLFDIPSDEITKWEDSAIWLMLDTKTKCVTKHNPKRRIPLRSYSIFNMSHVNYLFDVIFGAYSYQEYRTIIDFYINFGFVTCRTKSSQTLEELMSGIYLMLRNLIDDHSNEIGEIGSMIKKYENNEDVVCTEYSRHSVEMFRQHYLNFVQVKIGKEPSHATVIPTPSETRPVFNAPTTPEEFEEQMKKIIDENDPEEAHDLADELLCKVLTELGYGDGVNQFNLICTPKWNS